MKDKITYTFWIDKEDKKELTKKAIKAGRSLANLIRRILKFYLEEDLPIEDR